MQTQITEFYKTFPKNFQSIILTCLFLSLWPQWNPFQVPGVGPGLCRTPAPLPAGPNATVTQLSPWMDPFNNSQQNTKKKTWIQHKLLWIQTHLYGSLSSSPAWGRRVCVASLYNTLSGDAGRMVRCSTPGLTQHSLLNRTSYGGVTRRRGGGEARHFYVTITRSCECSASRQFGPDTLTPTVQIWDVSARTVPAQTSKTWAKTKSTSQTSKTWAKTKSTS